ncbi:MAG: hypothetical protein ABI633_09445 [Burkholderiales bacterium]
MADQLEGQPIRVADHRFGFAGQGSSCGGSLSAEKAMACAL